MDDVILIGYFNETAELCELCGCKIIGVVDSVKCQNYPYLGNDETFMQDYYQYINVPLVITPDRPVIRERLFNIYSNLGFKFKTLISPHAMVSPSASISEGCMIQTLCNISSEVKLGKCVRINTCANVMHDSYIGDFSIVAPNAVVLGRVNVGIKSYIGANSTLLPNLVVGNESIVGAGAVVTKNVLDKCAVAGVPAKILKEDI